LSELADGSQRHDHALNRLDVGGGCRWSISKSAMRVRSARGSLWFAT